MSWTGIGTTVPFQNSGVKCSTWTVYSDNMCPYQGNFSTSIFSLTFCHSISWTCYTWLIFSGNMTLLIKNKMFFCVTIFHDQMLVWRNLGKIDRNIFGYWNEFSLQGQLNQPFLSRSSEFFVTYRVIPHLVDLMSNICYIFPAKVSIAILLWSYYNHYFFEVFLSHYFFWNAFHEYLWWQKF